MGSAQLREGSGCTSLCDPQAKDTFVLGTAQLGMSYGVSSRGQPDFAAAEEIVATAWDRGVRFFDTAQSYGTSEETLGTIIRIRHLAAQANVISKIGSVGLEDISDSISGSLRRLCVDRLWALFLHDEASLDRWRDGLEDSLLALKIKGAINQIGISVYGPDRAFQALQTPGIDCVQVPTSLFDRRFIRAGLFEAARKANKTIFIRSVYLQGLVLWDGACPPAVCSEAPLAVETYRDFCRRRHLDRADFAVNYVRSQAPGFPIVLGIESREQLLQSAAIFANAAPDSTVYSEWTAEWPHDVPDLVDPRVWRKPPRP